jgi:hypothetical protein
MTCLQKLFSESKDLRGETGGFYQAFERFPNSRVIIYDSNNRFDYQVHQKGSPLPYLDSRGKIAGSPLGLYIGRYYVFI